MMIKALCVVVAVQQAAAHGFNGGHGLLASPVNLGFETIPLNQSFKHVPLQVNGTVPAFMKGTLYRGAPGAWPDGWWLDGLLTIHGFKFEDGQVFYSMRWSEDEAYNHTVAGTPAAKPLDQPEYPGGLRHPHNTSFPTGVAFRKINGALVTSTGVSNVNHIDSDTLASVELPFTYDDDLGAPFLSPTHAAEVDGYVLGHLVTGVQKGSGGTTGYVVTSIKPGTKTRDIITKIDNPGEASRGKGIPSFQHQPMATPDYYVMLEANCYYPDTVTNVGEVNWAGWKTDLFATAHVRVISRATGESLLYPLAFNIFAIHSINAHQDPETNSLILDTIQLFPSDLPCNLAFLGTKTQVLESGFAGYGYKMSKAFRLTMPLDKPGAKVEPRELLNITGVEFPTIRGDRQGKPYTYAYSNYISGWGKPFYDTIVKFNVKDGSVMQWRVEGHYPGEPIFVADPAGTSEDDGVVITNVLDTVNKESYLLVLDAKTMVQKARVGPTPHHIPHGFHGRYFEGPAGGKSQKAVFV